MRTKDITYGGVMIATFFVLSLLFRGNTRLVQTYLEIVKTMVIAVFMWNIKSNNRWIFALACFVTCLLFVSIPDTLIYDVPSIVGGSVVGLQKHKVRKVRNYLSYFIVHSVMMIYEIAMFGLLMNMNLFTLYRKQFSATVVMLTNGSISTTFMEILFVLFMVFDSAFSSFLIFSLVQVVLRKLDRATKMTDTI